MDIIFIEIIILWVSATGMLLTLVTRTVKTDHSMAHTEVVSHTPKRAIVLETVIGSTKEAGKKIARKHVQPVLEDVLIRGIQFGKRGIALIKAQFDALEDFVKGRQVIREAGAASWYLKNIKLHKDASGKTTTAEEKMRLSN